MTLTPTPAQRRFLKLHKSDEMLSRHAAHATYDFIGRIRRAGWITIVDGKILSWPYGWDGTRITEAGLVAIGRVGNGNP